MKTKKTVCGLICLFVTSSLSFSNSKLDSDLSYLKRVLSEAYAGYEYNVEQGFDFDAAIENVRNLYLRKSEESKLPAEVLSTEILTYCINKEILQKLKVPDNHFVIMSKGKFFRLKRHVWLSSEVYFAKQGDDYIVAFSNDSKIKKNSIYTGNPENLFKVIKDNKEYYVFGIQARNNIKEAEISINKNTFKIPVYMGNFAREYEPGHVGMQKTKKTLYLSFSDCLFNGYDRTTHTLLSRKVQDYLLELKKNSFENVIVDLRGNRGGIVGNITPVLATLNFEGDYKNLDKVYRKINTMEYTNFKKSELVDEASEKYQKDNPAYKTFIVEDSTTEYYRNNRVTEYNFEPSYKGNLIILCDFNSASASELFIAYSYIFENVYLIGTNSSGTIDFGGVFDYYLPESGIMLHLASGSLKNSDFLQKNPHWHGDTKGFYPDYWCTDSSLLPTLVAITKDKKLKKSLRGLHKQFL